MPFFASCGSNSSFQSEYCAATNSRAMRWMLLKVSVGLNPSGPRWLVSLSICCLIPATRISKNSSRFELKMLRNLTRSMSGCVGSCASSSTRRLNSSQLNSRLIKFFGSEKRFSAGTSFRRISTSAEGWSATVAFAVAVGIYFLLIRGWKNSAREFKQSLLEKLGNSQKSGNRRVKSRPLLLDAGCLRRQQHKRRLRRCWWHDPRRARDDGR